MGIAMENVTKPFAHKVELVEGRLTLSLMQMIKHSTPQLCGKLSPLTLKLRAPCRQP